MNISADIKEFNQLYNDYRERFVRFADSYVRDLAVAEDITVDALVYYWEKRQELPEDTNIPAYILTIIKHKCINHLEHLRVREEYAEKMRNHAAWELNLRISTLEACDPAEIYTKELQDAIDGVLASMSEQTRIVFQLNRYEGKSYKEIAILLNITPKGVEYHISKALSILRSVLQKYMHGNL
jgi:RNA polymerase sigma-70 factor (ECF subfamily)